MYVVALRAVPVLRASADRARGGSFDERGEVCPGRRPGRRPGPAAGLVAWAALTGGYGLTLGSIRLRAGGLLATWAAHVLADLTVIR